jgi:hypothetical protein
MPAAISPEPIRSAAPLRAATRSLAFLACMSWALPLTVLSASAPGRAIAADSEVTVFQPAMQPAPKIKPSAPPKPQPVVPLKVQPTLAPAAGSKGTPTQQALLKQRSTAVVKERTNAVLSERTTGVVKQRTSTVLKQRTTVLGSSMAKPARIIGGVGAPPAKTVVTRRILPH